MSWLSETRRGLTRRGLFKHAGMALATAAMGSSVIVGGSSESNATVYVGARGPVGEFGQVHAIDAATGDERWTFTEMTHPVESSPTVAGGTVYVGTGEPVGEGNLYAIDADSGEGIWTYTDIEGSIRSSPTVVDWVVYIGTTDGALHAVDAASGERLWAFTELGPHVWASPVVSDGVVVIGDGFGQIFALETDTGEVAWDFTSPDLWGHVELTAADGRLFVVGMDDSIIDGREPSGLTVFALDLQTGQDEWMFHEPDRIGHSAPTIQDDVLYVGLGATLQAIDVPSGERLWIFDDADGIVSSSPTIADDTVIVGSEEGTVYGVDASSGESVWAFTDPEKEVRSSPTVADGIAFVGSEDESLYAIDIEDGTGVWTFESDLRSWIHSSPTVVYDLEWGHSVDTRVTLGTLGHHFAAADSDPPAPAAYDGLSVSPTDGLTPLELTIEANVENVGDAGNIMVPLWVDGTVVDRELVTLDAGEATTVSFEYTLEESGDVHVTVGDMDPILVTPLTAANFAITSVDTNSPLAIGSPLEVAVVIENTGDFAGQSDITFRFDDAVIETYEIELDPGGRQLFTFSHDTTGIGEGEYPFEVITDDVEQTHPIEVQELAPTPTPTPTPPDDSPGFGVAATLTGLGGAAYLLKRRLEADDEDR